MTTRMIVLMVGLVALTLTVSAQVKERPEMLLQAAIKQELVQGCQGAVEQFKAIAAAARTANPAVAAEALVHMAACYDKLGQGDARGIYEQIVREYPNQKTAVVEANAWLTAHATAASAQAGRSVEQIWTGPDVNLEGQPSADGRYLTFVDWNRDANLAVRDLRTGENRLLTHDPPNSGFAANPIPSPDGRQIAYSFLKGEKDFTIRLINSDGSGMRELTHDGHANYLVGWSPDGKSIAATHDNGDQTQAIVLISTSDGSITQLKSTSSAGATLGGFSPDGRFLVYAMDKNPQDSATGNGGVFLLATDATREVPLVQGPAGQGAASFRAPGWSPDGRRIIFVSDRSGAPGLWATQVANGQPEGAAQLIQANIGSMRPMGFTREGAFYYGTVAGQSEAYTAEFDQETLTVARPAPVTDRFVGNNQRPELSPDGSYVAFIRSSGGSQPREVVVRSSATGAERTLTTLIANAYVRSLQWFPDGRSLLVVDAAERRKRFRQVTVASGEARVLFDGPWEVGIGALSADGKSLFYSIREEGTLRLVKRLLQTGEETEVYRRIESDSESLFGLTVSPDGTRLAFAVNTGNGRALMIVPIEGGAPREIARRSGYNWILPVSAMAWTKDGRHIVFSGTCGGPWDTQRLCAISTEGGELKPMGLRMQSIPTRMISADGRRIAFTGATQKRELWVIRNLLPEPAQAR